jgi:hypothetical protein
VGQHSTQSVNIMKVKISRIIEDCIERGVARGYRRAHKHNENPDTITLFSSLEDCIMAEIYEYISFDDEINE